jgi:hypothetical protein
MDKIQLIADLKDLAAKLRITIDDAVRNDYEYQMMYLNIALAEEECEYEKAQQDLDDKMDAEF